MKIEKVIVTVDDGSSDSIGGVHYERIEVLPYETLEPVIIKCSNSVANYEITLDPWELGALSKALKREPF